MTESFRAWVRFARRHWLDQVDMDFAPICLVCAKTSVRLPPSKSTLRLVSERPDCGPALLGNQLRTLNLDLAEKTLWFERESDRLEP